MVGSIRKLLWGAFFALVALIGIALAVNFAVLNSERRQEYLVVQGTEPLLDAVHVERGVAVLAQPCERYAH